MKNPFLIALIILIGLTLVSHDTTAATTKGPAATINPMTIKQNLSVKDDRGNNWILKNAEEYQMKWAYEDPSPHQRFKGSVSIGGKLLLITFGANTMALNLNGKIVWNPTNYWDRDWTIGMDDTTYFLDKSDKDEDYFYSFGIERIDAQGNHINIPFTSVSPPWNLLTTGDAKGNFLLLSEDGLTSYRPDGKIGWRLNKLNYKNRSYSVLNILNLSSDKEGYSYLQFYDKMLKIDQAGKVQWSIALPPNDRDYTQYYYIAGKYIIGSDYGTIIDVYSRSAESKVTLVTDPKVLYRLSNDPIDQLGGIYMLDEETNTLTDRDWFTGKTKWSYKQSKYLTSIGQSIAKSTLRTDPTGNVYFSANVGTVYALDQRGKPRFTVVISNKTIGFSDIIPISDKLTIILNNNHIVCIEKKSS
ncbi:MAG: hypothetical protein P0Y55_17795 [Candidatus Cohnella colombiensis]|uniref:Uncharacterized protein n=1 Tax=Candidatus Cohnella colombiensis TaxID=3121368 RepID=A0AA95EZY3_9BACL|nr:MAG: hypothetical protein P0Y55_17795 [Cohnella sp.]